MNTDELQRIKNKYEIIGDNAALNTAIEMAVAAGITDIPVLILGESGVGKDVIPQIIHNNSRRKTSRYFAVNCGAIPEGTIDSELFGHEKGSFTGAIEARKGYFEEADGGTLFLDEIGELPLSSQAKLLRVLQSGEYIRVGSSKVSKTDVRVIAATNVDLQYAVSQGRFREDLYYRLYGLRIFMPPLRDRKEDIDLLFRKFTSDFSEKYNMSKINLSRDAIDKLISYRWPGNIRQLRNVAESVSTMESVKITPTSGRIVIDGATLEKYLPKEEANVLPVRVGAYSNDVSDNVKSELYKAIFTLRSEVEALKKIVISMQGGHPEHHYPLADARHSIPESHRHDTASAIITAPEDNWDDVDIQEIVPADSVRTSGTSGGNIREIEINPVGYKEASESVSIEQARQDLIRKALERNNGNRKKAAEELGISERTLYRKLPDEYKNPKKLSED